LPSNDIKKTRHQSGGSFFIAQTFAIIELLGESLLRRIFLKCSAHLFKNSGKDHLFGLG
jgi:hypothetical protein